jgi:predicted extracellular nuclease
MKRRCLLGILLVFLLAACGQRVEPPAVAPDGGVDTQAAAELFFSEYIEGSSNNKALEIYNGTGAAVDLADVYSVQMYFNGSTSAGLTINLTGTIMSGDVFVLAHSSAVAAILAEADQTNGSGWFNGDDAVVLRKGTTVLDIIGQIGVDPGAEWGSGLTSTADNTLRRKAAMCAGDTNGTDAFDPATAWDGFATDSFDGLGSHSATCTDAAPTITSTTPADEATNAALDAGIVITFSEPVNVNGTWFTLTCETSGSHTPVVTGGPTTFTLKPAAGFAKNERCTATVTATQVSDQDSNDPPDTMTADHSWTFTTTSGEACSTPYTSISTIQGSGATSPFAGQTHTVKGVVVGDYEGPSPTLRGFYVQEAEGDGDPATSDGIFVFNGSDDKVGLGQVVYVTGTVSEFQGQTQLGSVTSIVPCGEGSVEPVDVTLPFPSADYLERFEGMLVRLPQTLYVTEHFQLGRFGQVVMSSGGRLSQPTNVVAPGAAARALQAENNLNRIIIDDALNSQNPDPIFFGRGGESLSASNTLRGGDTATGIIGVMTYTWAGNSASGNAYRVRPINALGGGVPVFESGNDRPASPSSVGGTLRVAAFNVLNYFNTFSGCTGGVAGSRTDCRGADNEAEFDRQAAKTVAAIDGLDADIVGLIEIENDGYGPSSAIADLVSRLNAATSPGTYAFIDVDTATGKEDALGTDAIKVGFIYKPERVTPVGQTAVLNTDAFVNGGDSAPRNRPALTQAFEQPNGARLIVSVNHFKSKGSACSTPDANDGQANCNQVRVNAATELVNWLAADPTGTGDPDVLIIGDLNAYAKENPITTILSAGYANLIEEFLGPDAYSYAFDGQWGYLDHALASTSLSSQVAGVTEWHINADEPTVLDYNTNFKSADQVASLYAPDPYRASDHDPVLVGLNLNVAPSITSFTLTLPSPNLLPNTIIVGQSVTAIGAFTDPDVQDTHTARFSWGDGETAEVDPASSPATREHTYERSGVYTVTFTVTDKDDSVGTATANLSVLSPAGAVDALRAKMQALGLQKGIRTALLAQLNSAAAAIARGEHAAAADSLVSFIGLVEEQRGKRISSHDADLLIAVTQATVQALNTGLY